MVTSRARVVLMLAAVVAAPTALGCTRADLHEDPAHCGDGIDNDLDGLTDAADPDCQGGTENTLALCRDGIDNDGNHLVDCADPGCVSSGNCAAFSMPSCQPLLSSMAMAMDGCPSGMGCFYSPMAMTWECRLIGSHTERQPCRTSGYGPSEPHDCAASYTCVAPTATPNAGYCDRLCNDQMATVCEHYSYCLTPSAGSPPHAVSDCSPICDPRIGVPSGCPTGFRCHTGQQDLSGSHSYANGYAFFTCQSPSVGVIGTATAGQTCADPANASTALSSICGDGLVCIPGTTAGSGTCSTVCNATTGAASTGCPSGQPTCTPIDTGLTFNPVGFGSTQFGYCH
jgi:hypothetical protein